VNYNSMMHKLASSVGGQFLGLVGDHMEFKVPTEVTARVIEDHVKGYKFTENTEIRKNGTGWCLRVLV